jgi:hypothetical protein
MHLIAIQSLMCDRTLLGDTSASLSYVLARAEMAHFEKALVQAKDLSSK